jgi:hypothetical protein
MKDKKLIEKDKLVMCKDCANYPTMCGYYQNRYVLHPCPDKGEGQHGFRPATEMSLSDTVHHLKKHLKGHDKNEELFHMTLYYLQQGEKDKDLLNKSRKRNKVLETRIKDLKDVLKKTENIVRRKHTYKEDIK